MTCDWPILYAGCGGGDGTEPCGDLTKVSEEIASMIEEMAVDWLRNATGGIFGVCDEEVRPCRQDCTGNADWSSTFWGRGPGFDRGFPRLGGAGGGGAFYPVLVSGQWHNITCGCLGSCRCSPSGPAALSLPGPIDSITEVTIDGDVIPEDSYRVERGRWLIRTDGSVWPGCQNMNAPDDGPGSFLVKYKRGVPVPAGGKVAAGVLAEEMAKAWCGNPNCGLPDNWQTLSRQGIQVTAPDASDGKTGIWLIDNWVESVNKPKPIALVRSVDIPVR